MAAQALPTSSATVRVVQSLVQADGAFAQQLHWVGDSDLTFFAKVSLSAVLLFADLEKCKQGSPTKALKCLASCTAQPTASKHVSDLGLIVDAFKMSLLMSLLHSAGAAIGVCSVSH